MAMNYFELYDLPVQLSVDKALVRKKYFELSRRYHPDYFIQQDATSQQEALDQSAMINKAYKTFSSQDETIRYVLAMKGLLTENEKYELPPAFLMDMMELNESVAEASFDPAARAAVLQKVLQTEALLYQPVQPIIEQYQENRTTQAQLLQVKDYYFKKKYLERLKQQLGEML
jgi:molecular chaperone HscB